MGAIKLLVYSKEIALIAVIIKQETIKIKASLKLLSLSISSKENNKATTRIIKNYTPALDF